MTAVSRQVVAQSAANPPAWCIALRIEFGSRQFLEAGAGRTGEIPPLFAEPQLIPSPSLASRLG